MPTLTIATTDRHLEGILALQRRFLARTSPPEQQAREGFVYVEHTLPLLRQMAAVSPQAIALEDDRVVGYCLSLHPSLRAAVPSLGPMFEQFSRCAWRGRPLGDLRIIVGGQVCVDRSHRGRGLLARLYDQVRVSLPFTCDLCVTEVATRNVPSMRAHLRMGFEPVHTYPDGHEEWVVVAWDLTHPPADQGSLSAPRPAPSRAPTSS